MIRRASSLLPTLLLGCYSVQDVSVPGLLSQSDSDQGVVTAMLVHDREGPTPLLITTVDGVSTVYRGCGAAGQLAVWLPESSTVSAVQFPIGRIVESTGQPLLESEVCVRAIKGCVANACGDYSEEFTVERRRTCWKHKGLSPSNVFKYAEWSKAGGWVTLGEPEVDRVRCSVGLEIVEVSQ